MSTITSFAARLPKPDFFDKAAERLSALDWDDLSAIPSPVAIAFGAGSVCGILARHMAALVADKKITEAVFFAGGGSPLKTPLARHLVKKLEKEGVPAPRPEEDEATYMLRVFHDRLKDLGIEQSPVRVEAEPLREVDGEKRRSLNTQENIAFLSDILPPTKTLTLVVIPFHAPRAIGTVRKFFNDTHQDIALRAEMVWPKEFGITKETWRTDTLALTAVFLESRKYGVCEEKSMYVRKGFCVWIDPVEEKRRYMAAANL